MLCRDILNSFHLLGSCAASSELREPAEEAVLVSDALCSLVTLSLSCQRIPKLLGRLVFSFSLVCIGFFFVTCHGSAPTNHPWLAPPLWSYLA
jgi:hypothetical protein